MHLPLNVRACMEITNAKQAREWISNWKGTPRFASLKAVVEGMQCVIGLCDGRLPVSEKGYEEALAVMIECLRVCFPDRVHEVDFSAPAMA